MHNVKARQLNQKMLMGTFRSTCLCTAACVLLQKAGSYQRISLQHKTRVRINVQKRDPTVN